MNATNDSGVPRLIDTVDEIDASWIESVLRRAGVPDPQVVGVDVAPIGAGNVSDTVRVDITFRGEAGDAPRALVVKLKPSDPAVHAHGLNSGAYHREIGGYRAIAERHACRIPQPY